MKNLFSRKVKIKLVYAGTGKKFCTCKLTKEEFHIICEAANVGGETLEEFLQSVIDELVQFSREELAAGNLYKKKPLEKRKAPEIPTESGWRFPGTNIDVISIALGITAVMVAIFAVVFMLAVS